mgnify:CR=1 FL=1
MAFNKTWLPTATRRTWKNPNTGEAWWDAGVFVRDNPLLCWHTTEGHQSLPGYQNSRGQSGGYAPTFTIVVKARQFFQHMPMNRASRALPAYNDQAVQVEITGSCSISWSKKAGLVYVGDFTKEDLAYINKCMREIAEACGIPWEAPFRFSSYEALSKGSDNVRQSVGRIRAARGIVGHQHMPSTTHLDPGVLGNLLLASNTVPVLPEPVEEYQDLSPLTADNVKRLQTYFQMPVADGKTSSPSAWIERLQRTLNGKHGKKPDYKILTPDGYCGPATRAAVQMDLGVKTWAEVPAAWMKRLDSIYNTKPTTTTTKIDRTLKVGVKGEDVKLLQSTLKSWFGYASKLSVDGNYGPATSAAVAEFQRRSKLSGKYADDIDGIVGPNTLRAMRALGMKL